MRWAALNKPAGLSIIKWGAKFARVTLVTKSHKILRKRSKTQNLYKLDDVEFTAFGNEVPNDISNKLRLSDINFQSQQDAAFWFNLSAGEVSRRLNSIVNLQAIDSTLSHIASQLRDAGIEARMSERRMQQALRTKQSLSFVTEMQKSFKSIESMHKRCCKDALEASQMRQMLDLIAEQSSVRDNALETLTEAQKAMSEIEAYKKLQSDADCLEKQLAVIDEAQSIIDQPIPDLSDSDKLAKKIKRSQVKLKTLKFHINTIERCTEEITDADAVVLAAENAMKKLARERCPLCGSDMKTNVL
jgi:hypothetical protein